MDDPLARFPALATMQATQLFADLGFRFTAAEPGFAELTFEAGERVNNLYGMVHGGAWLFLADAAMGGALATVAGSEERVITTQADFRWLRPLAGRTLIARARVLRRGRTVSHCTVDIFDQEGRQLGAGTGTYVVVAGE